MRPLLPFLALISLLALGCGRVPTPLAPQVGGSIGMPHRGVLTNATELPRHGDGWVWLRDDDRHYGTPRFVAALERAATTVARERPGGILAFGDLSQKRGGQLLPHLSHRSGRDADLLLYMTTLDGAPVRSPGFIHVERDGLAWDEKSGRFLRFDVERQWLLVKTLVEDPEARIQWIFASDEVEAMLVEWARARGESSDTIVRAMDVMVRPRPGGAHDDHVHVRTACTLAELSQGCEATGPKRAWIEALDQGTLFEKVSADAELAQWLARPLSPPMSRRADGVLVHGDARELGDHVARGSADLAYLDPPFKVEKAFSARVAKGARAKGPVAYDDTWPSLEAYLAWLEERIAVVHHLLSERGTMWLHLDQRAVHEAKGVCDRVFGKQRFHGEVIWVPGNGSKSRSGPGIAHQTLLLYSRGKSPLWNAKDPALRGPFAKTSQSMHFTRRDDTGRRYRDRVVGGKTYRYYADEGRALGSVWNDCPSMSANTPLRSETTGYPTQKPLKLLDRIVRASSAPGSLVVDPFCGSGTTLVAASAADRTFAGSDVGALAISTTKKRLTAAGVVFRSVRD